MDKLEEKLNHYLDAEQADLAIEIDGAWGMGKTYTLKKYFEKRKDERLVYISVNGVQASKVDDLFYEAAIAAGSYVKNPDIKVRTNLTFNLNYLI